VRPRGSATGSARSAIFGSGTGSGRGSRDLDEEGEAELLGAIIKGVGGMNITTVGVRKMSVAMRMDEAGRWRIARGQLKE